MTVSYLHRSCQTLTFFKIKYTKKILPGKLPNRKKVDEATPHEMIFMSDSH